MTIADIAEDQCRAVLARGSIGRLGCCFNSQPYVVPVYFAFADDSIYVFSTFGQKIEWMRSNPAVCLQVDEITSKSEWVSVIVDGKYDELRDPQRSAERAHAREVLEKRHRWWLNAVAERRARVNDLLIEPLFFRIHIDSITGLKATEETGPQ
jgi:uncharacterized protein